MNGNSKHNPMNISDFKKKYSTTMAKNIYVTLNNRMYLVNNNTYSFIGFTEISGGGSKQNLQKKWEDKWKAEIKLQKEIEKLKNYN